MTQFKFSLGTSSRLNHLIIYVTVHGYDNYAVYHGIENVIHSDRINCASYKMVVLSQGELFQLYISKTPSVILDVGTILHFLVHALSDEQRSRSFQICNFYILVIFQRRYIFRLRRQLTSKRCVLLKFCIKKYFILS